MWSMIMAYASAAQQRNFVPRRFLLAGVILLAGSLFGCNGNAPAPGKSTPFGNQNSGLEAGQKSGSEAGQTADAGEVKIGVVMTMSGPVAPYGQECSNGFKLAIEQAGDKQAHKVDLIILDDKGESIEAVNSVTQLVEVNKVAGLVGAIASTNTLAVAKVAQESQVPLLVPVSTNADITKTGDYIFRTCFSDPFQGQVLAKFARENLKATRAAVITDKAMDYSVGLAHSFKENFEKLGGTLAGEVSYSSGDADYSAVVATVNSFKPDVVFIPGQYADVGAMLKQAKGSWDSLHKLGGDSWDSPGLIDVAGPAVYGSYICSHFSAEDTTPKVKHFVEEFKQKFGITPGAMGCLGYDGGLVLLDALKRIEGPVTREKLKQALGSTKGVEGISGVIVLNKDREVAKDAIILKVTRDGFKFDTRVKF